MMVAERKDAYTGTGYDMGTIASRTLDLHLTVRDIAEDDLPGLTWCGSRLHVAHIAEEVRSAPATREFLAAFLPDGRSVGKGEIDYAGEPHAGQIGSLAVRDFLQSLGIGTFLIDTAEQRIRDRGLHRAVLDVEDNNPRARALYERLGYVAYDRRPESWDQQAPDGRVYRYETTCTYLRKDLPG